MPRNQLPVLGKIMIAIFHPPKSVDRDSIRSVCSATYDTIHITLDRMIMAYI